MVRPMCPRVTNAQGDEIAVTFPPEPEEPPSEAEGTSWRKRSRGAPDSDESWTPSINLKNSKSKRSARVRSRADNTRQETDSESDSSESSDDNRKRSSPKRRNISGAKKRPAKKLPAKLPRLAATKVAKTLVDKPIERTEHLESEMDISDAETEYETVGAQMERSKMQDAELNSEKETSVLSDVEASAWKGPGTHDNRSDSELHTSDISDAESEYEIVSALLKNRSASESELNVSDAVTNHEAVSAQMAQNVDSESDLDLSDAEATAWTKNTKMKPDLNNESDDSTSSEAVASTWRGPPQDATDYDNASDGSGLSDVVASAWKGPTKENSKQDDDSDDLGESDVEAFTWSRLPKKTSVNDNDGVSDISSVNDGQVSERTIEVGEVEDSDEEYNSDSGESDVLAYSWKDPKSADPTQANKRKPRTRRQYTNNAVKRLEREGQRATIVMPKLQSYSKPKSAKPKPKAKKERDPDEPLPKYTCDQCGLEFNKKGNRDRHVKNVHNGKITQCAICGSKLSSDRAWREHNMRFHNEDHVDLLCVYCGKPFTCQNGRRNHYRRGCDKDPNFQNNV